MKEWLVIPFSGWMVQYHYKDLVCRKYTIEVL
jgi:hypothetical protein